MDWRKIAINTLSAFLVAVGSGVLVWLLTRDPAPREGLEFSRQSSAVYGSGVNQLSSSVLTVVNNGRAKSNDVEIQIDLPKSSRIEDVNVFYKSPKPEGVVYNRTVSSYSITVPTFLPSDRVTVSLLSRGPSAGNYTPSIRSNESIAIEHFSGEPTPYYLRWQLFISLLAMAIFPFATRWLSKLLVKRISPFIRNERNNSGFLLLHAGLPKYAETVLDLAVKAGSTGPIVLSNLAVARELNGDSSDADGLMHISRYWLSDKHSTGVFLFNRGLIAGLRGKADDCVNDIKAASEKSDTIEGYFKSSAIVADLRAKLPKVESYATQTMGMSALSVP